MEAWKSNGIVIKTPTDHWAFLEDIEAPMWADLTLEAEANSVGEHMSDEWFNISHPFHQCSARQLKSKFSHPGEGILTSEVDAEGPASPELPSSVSRSRGKHYNSKKWGGMNLNILLDKQQGLSRRCFPAGSSFGQEVKPKSKSNVSRPKGPPSAKLGLASERKARRNAKSKASCSNAVSSSSTVDNTTGESNTRSTITSEKTQQKQKYMEVSSKPCDQRSSSSSVRSVSLRKSCVTKKASGVQQQQKYVEVSSQSCDQKNGSSSVSSVSLRKSCATRKASRVEIGGDNMQSRGRKSSSGKSSVGSSSNPGYEVKFVSKQQREKITDGKDVVTTNLPDKNKCKPANISQTSAILVEGAKSSNRKGSNVNLAKPAYHRTAKSLVQYQSIRSRALLPAKVNKENSCNNAKEKLGASKVNSLTSKGKENAAKNVTVNQKYTERGVPDGGVLKNHRSTERSCQQKGDTAGSVALTILGKRSST